MQISDRLTSAKKQSDDEKNLPRIRPLALADYLGQASVCEQMGLFIHAARARNEALDHVLIVGPPGLGKTTLAHIIAHEMGVALKQTSGPILERAGDLAALLTHLEHEFLTIGKEPCLICQIRSLHPASQDKRCSVKCAAITYFF